MTYIDTHFHLDLCQQPAIVESIENEKIYTIAVTNTPSVFHYSHRIASTSKFIRAALGLHPQLAGERVKELSLFHELLSQTRYVGEIGLDDRSSNTFSVQRYVFEKIVNLCADAGNKILTVHSRRADREVLDVIGDQFPGKIILHWFSGSINVLERAIEVGCYFSVNYAMANSPSGKKLIQRIPLERLLTESDGPFVEFRNQPCSPLHIPPIVNSLVMAKTEFEDDTIVKKQIYKNFQQLLG